MRRILATAVSALAFTGTGYSQELKAKWPGVDSAELTKLADRLGDRDYRSREQAGKRLLEVGADALPALHTAAEAGNLEAADRALGLIAKIEKRLGNAREIAGTPVELKGEQTLGAAFDTLRKQTGYTIQLNGDQSPRSKKLMPKAGKLVFWESLQNVLDQAELEVETSAAIQAPVNLPQQLRSGDEVYDGPTPLPASGTVVVRAKQSKVANPLRISGAFRIEAIPVPIANLPQMPANRVPVLLQITPEPRFRWLGTTETIVTMAKNQDGHTLSWDFVALDHQPMNYGYGRRAQLGRVKGGGYYAGPIVSSEFPANQFQAYVKLAANPAGPSTVLKEFEGLIRGRFWSRLEVMLATSSLNGIFEDMSGPNHTSLKAKVEPMPGDPSALLLSVTHSHNASEVVPFHGSSALNTNPDGLWLENGPGGRVKMNAVKLTPEELRMAQGFTNAYGLALVDGNGKPMNLSPHTATQQNHYDAASNSSTFVVTSQYVVRPATKDEAGKPAKLTFSGSRVKTVEIPFAFKAVPVLLGTGTNVQARTNVDIYDR